MQTTKRKRTDEDTECLITNQNAYAGKEICPYTAGEAGFGNLSKCGESSSLELDTRVASVLSQVVVSLASFVGDTMYRRCAGIFVHGLYANDMFVLTSADLVRSSMDENEIVDNLMIKVRLPDNQVVIGLLHHYDLKHGIVIVNIEHVDGFRAANISSRSREFESNSEVVAVGRCFDTGMLKAASGIMTGRLTNELSEVTLSTCKINEAWIGGPLVGLDGYFAGMNCRDGEKAAFLPRNRIIECLDPFGILRVDFNRSDGTRKVSTIDDELLDVLREVSRCNGYPLPTKICEEVHKMHVINSFEKEFDGDIWSTLSKDIDTMMSDCVVSLASFNGDARVFACTGIFINCYPARILTSASLVRKSDDENNIDDDLWIQVSLWNKRRVRGTLKHYNLHYNVAVIDIMGGFHSPRAIELEKHISFAPNTEVVALGCRFNKRKTMATKGVLTDKQSELDCKELKLSTCKITKAGIGGPLIDGHGNFVGMNFYDDEETPYLPRIIIQKVLKSFDAKRHTAAETTTEVAPNRWPVPKPVWYCPNLQEVVLELFEEVDGVLQIDCFQRSN